MIGRLRKLFLVAGALVLGANVAWAAWPDIAAGRALAYNKCARCHAVGKKGASPFKPAPPFRTFAKKWPLESLEEALAEGIMVGHPVMPDFAPMSPREVDGFIAYLRSIQMP